MAYIVLALGLLMALAGLGAMASGYPVIEIERGWATVISGAVLLSGGLMTVALGIVARLLVDLKRGLRTPVIGAAATNTAAAAPASAEPLVLPTPAAIAPSKSAEPRLAPSAPSALEPASDLPDPRAAVVAAAAGLRRSLETRAVTTSPAEAPAPAAPQHQVLPQPLPHDEEARSIAEHPAEATPPYRLADDIEPDIAAAPDRLEAVDPGNHHDAPSPEPALPAATNEAWLDQAFQAFDYEMTLRHGTEAETLEHPEVPMELEAGHPTLAAEEPLPEPAEELAHETAWHESSIPEHETTHEHDHEHTHEVASAEQAPSVAPAAAEAPSNLTVIGRYDSEGTSYVMYSDGSIEAQSEAGVYRFGSMAELKAFIEG